eukprot:4775286-Pyramimonas_sp.AAC.1
MEGYEYMSAAEGRSGPARAPRVKLNSARDGRVLGVVPASINLLFDSIAQMRAANPSVQVAVKVSFMQIYKVTRLDRARHGHVQRP